MKRAISVRWDDYQIQIASAAIFLIIFWTSSEHLIHCHNEYSLNKWSYVSLESSCWVLSLRTVNKFGHIVQCLWNIWYVLCPFLDPHLTTYHYNVGFRLSWVTKLGLLSVWFVKGTWIRARKHEPMMWRRATLRLQRDFSSSVEVRNLHPELIRASMPSSWSF